MIILTRPANLLSVLLLSASRRLMTVTTFQVSSLALRPNFHLTSREILFIKLNVIKCEQ
jgi:hypothetical protein